MLRISGIDTSSRLIGWTSGTGETVPECGAWSLDQAGDDLGLMIEFIHQKLVLHMERFQPEAVIIEAPIHKPTDKLLTMRKLYNAHGHVEWFFSQHVGVGKVETSEVSAQDIKSRVTGNRFAEKEDVVAVARKCGLDLPKVGYKDAADAWGAWLLGLDHYNRPLQSKWDKMIYGRRGALL